MGNRTVIITRSAVVQAMKFGTNVLLSHKLQFGKDDLSSEFSELNKRFAELRRDLRPPDANLRRSRRSSCPGGSGNLGFNSFNFMAFVVLVFNVVANVNNNLNNNNNNINDNNVNAISQSSNNVASTVNAANQIGVTVLPIPGKRSIRLLRNYFKKNFGACSSSASGNSTLTLGDALASTLYSDMVGIHEEEEEGACSEHKICLAFKNMLRKFGFKDLINLELKKAGKNPSLAALDCGRMFQSCRQHQA